MVHSMAPCQMLGCHICVMPPMLVRLSRNGCADAPQREPRHPQRRDTPGIIIVVIVVITARQRGGAKHESGHDRSIGRPKVGCLQRRRQPMSDMRNQVCLFTICFASSALSMSSSGMSASGGRWRVGCGASSRSTIILDPAGKSDKRQRTY